MNRYVSSFSRLVGTTIAGFFLICGPALAGGVEQLKTFSDSRLFAEGRFEQVVTNPAGAVKQKAKGQFAFSRPGKFRWSIEKPFPQLIVSNGKTVITYDEDLEQASERPLGDAIASSPAALLFGNEKVDKLFNLKNTETKNGLEWLEATPKNAETLFDRMRVGMKGGIPVEMEIFDSMGQRTVLQLVDWKLDKAPAASLFSFTPPPGVDMIRAK
ncbi:MAG: outer membrane lipoprotein chaperone LolA [Limnobacter sp.]|nr:outer membrane lipoprotein chaperone LolA [Limnobacter sp.]